jgi:dihydrofolate reductase
MGKVILGATMSLDGFINDRYGSVERLYPDLSELRKTELLQEEMATTGAVVMGRHSYDMGEGDFTDYEFQVPIFVLTHHVPEKAAKGTNDKLTLTFVTDGLESAVRQAKAAAGAKNVAIVGGASTAQQCLRAGLVDELQMGIRPVLFGEGLRFFDDLGPDPVQLEIDRVVETPGVTYLIYRVGNER